MANRRTESVPLPQRRGGAAPRAGVQGVPMLSARGLAQAASQDDGSAALASQAADMFGRTAARIGEMADRAAIKEGKEAGALAGRDREFRPRGDQTLYSRAFDQAGLETFKAKMSVDLETQMGAAAEKHGQNPQALAEALDGVRAGWQDVINDPGLAPHVKPEFEAQFTRASVGHMRDAQRALHARVRSEQAAALEAERDMRARSAEQQAFRLGLDETADKVLAGELADLKRRLGARDPDGKLIVSPEQQVKLLRDTQQGMARARVTGAFSRLPDLASRVRFLDDLEQRYQAGGDRVLDQFDPEQYQALMSTLSSQARQEGLGQAQSSRELRRAVKAFGDAAKSGIALKDEELSALKARVASSSDPEIVDAFSDALDTLGLVKDLNTTPPTQIEAAVDLESARLAKEGASLDDPAVRRLGVMRDYLKSAHTQLASDQLGFAAKAGVATIEPISLADPVSLGRRAAAAEHVAGFYGREVRYFRPEEKEALAAVSRKGGADMLAVAAAIVSGMGSNAPAALAEISKEASALAMVGGIWSQIGGTEPPKAALDAAKGIELRALPDYKELTTSVEMKRETAAVVGASLKHLLTDNVGLLNTAKAIYEARAMRDQRTAFDPGEWRQAVRDALGEHEQAVGSRMVKYGGVVAQNYWFASDGPEIVLPPTVRQDKWHEVIQMIRVEDLDAAGLARPAGADGNPISMDRIRNGRLVQVADGKYRVALGRPSVDGGQDYVPNFLLDLNALVPVLSPRRPDLFYGGG